MKTAASIFFILAALGAMAQSTFQKVKTIAHGKSVRYASVDRPGELYVIFEDNTIQRYATSGELMAEGVLPFRPDVFDPRDGSRLFAFNRDRNEFLFFAPFFSLQNPPQPFDSAFVIDPFMACSSGDRDLMIVDAADWSLKKVNLRTNRLLFETVISDSVSALARVVFMREYQNLVFMLDPKKGIRIFNMLGRPLHTIPAPGLLYFSFLGEEVYHKAKDTLVFYDLFSAETRSLKLPYEADFALLTDERLYLIKGKTTEVFSVKP